MLLIAMYRKEIRINLRRCYCRDEWS